MDKDRAKLVLEDGTVFEGIGFGGNGEAMGRVIFYTGVVGYQEMMTDPANAGRIIIFTYPLIGNYGVSPKFSESEKVWCSGIVMKEKSRLYSNWQATESFDSFLERNRVIVLTNVDTRTLMVHLREKGELWGGIASSRLSVQEILSKIENFRNEEKKSFLSLISVKERIILGKNNAKKRLGILDLGITKSIISQLERLGIFLIRLPYRTSFKEILDLKLNGLIVSNGPEEDPALQEVVENIRPLIGRIPLLGISTGFQVLARAMELKIKLMKLGHHGLNYPLRRPGSYKGEITVQNHSYVVEREDLEKRKELKITADNLNDHTVEEIENKKLRVLGVQYYPANPAFAEVHPVFKRFIEVITK